MWTINKIISASSPSFLLLALSLTSSIFVVTAQLRDEIDCECCSFFLSCKCRHFLNFKCLTQFLPTSLSLHMYNIVKWNTVKMPFPVSDVMANYMAGNDEDEDGFIIITGGCDSINGNERITIDNGNNETLDLFECMSITNATLKFDPRQNTFTRMADAPHARGRHAAAVVQGELYLFGGRDAADNLVSAIDVSFVFVFSAFCCLFLCFFVFCCCCC
jgi:hypothetical protein